jgi:hypothetical protein
MPCELHTPPRRVRLRRGDFRFYLVTHSQHSNSTVPADGSGGRECAQAHGGLVLKLTFTARDALSRPHSRTET